MNHWQRILRDLKEFYDEKGPGNYGVAHSFPSFVPDKPAYIAALNQLLREELVLGVPVKSDATSKDRVAIGLNPDRVGDIRKELSLWYRDPKFVIPAMVGVLALAWAVVQVFL